MTISKMGILAAALSALVLAGCSSSRFSSLDTRPEPLTAAPSGTVTAGSLPPPATPDATDPSAFPPPPGGTDVAALPPADAQPPANAPDLTANAMTGVWTANVSGQSCKIAMGLTKMGQAYRAAPLRCSDQAAAIKSWDVRGKQLVMFDATGTEVATLYSTADKRFDGQMKTGAPISLALQ